MPERDYTDKPFVPTAAPAAPAEVAEPVAAEEVTVNEQERIAAIKQEDAVLGTGAEGCLEHPALNSAEFADHDHKETN